MGGRERERERELNESTLYAMIQFITYKEHCISIRKIVGLGYIRKSLFVVNLMLKHKITCL
jgi:hypothetical protein